MPGWFQFWSVFFTQAGQKRFPHALIVHFATNLELFWSSPEKYKVGSGSIRRRNKKEKHKRKSFGPAISPVPPGAAAAGRKFCRGQETTPTGTAAAADRPASQTWSEEKAKYEKSGSKCAEENWNNRKNCSTWQECGK